MTNSDEFIHTITTTNNKNNSSTNNTSSTPTDLAELVDGSAAYYAHYQRLVVEDELRSASSPDGSVRHLLVAGVDDDRIARELNLPMDRDERRDCYEVAEEISLELPEAAVMSCPGLSHELGREIVLVFASDRAGGHEAWAAEVTRALGQRPRIGGWKRVEVGGVYAFMVYIAVGNFAV